MSVFNLRISWSISRGRDTYGYNICRLEQGGKRWRTLGGGYDMIGTVIGDWFQDRHQAKLQALVAAHADKLQDCGYATPGYKQMRDTFYGLTVKPNGLITLDGACGVESMLTIIRACGFSVEWYGDRKGHTQGYLLMSSEVQS